VRYAFVAEHRTLSLVRVICRCLRIRAGGFCCSLKNPLSRRAKEGVRQTDLLRQAWEGSGKVYGYRKPNDDLLDQGETCSPN
jgi:putative transposase